MKNYLEIFFIAFRLGCTSFGGPTAHLGYFQKEYVQKKKWLTDQQYADLVALSQFLPGPASSQVGMGIGLIRGGIVGSILAFIGFTLPSVIFLICFALFLTNTTIDLNWIQGLKLVAIAIVAQAIVDMSKKLLPTIHHVFIALLALSAMLLFQTSWLQIIIILIAAITGQLILKNRTVATTSMAFSKKMGITCLSLFFGLLVLLPLLANTFQHDWLYLIEKFYMAGAFVFGGGHVVLPLLETQFVETGLMSTSSFLAGYGITQAMPGPLFTFATYIGTTLYGVSGGLLATFAIFLPAFLLIIGALPFWQVLSTNAKLRGAVSGMNAAVVGILAAAFITPITWYTITSIKDVIFAVVLLLIVFLAKQPPIVTVIIGFIIGVVFY